jgi:pfkB family carbohydrate kinase
VIIDPNIRPAIFGDTRTYRRRFEHLAQLADVVKLSEDDAAWIYPRLPAEAVLEHILGFGPRIVALTRGENGALAASGDTLVTVAGIPVTVVDTVGAGDSFGAALIAALLDDGAFGPKATTAVDEPVLTRATSYAVTASAITCTRTGAVPPSRREIETQLRILQPTPFPSGATGRHECGTGRGRPINRPPRGAEIRSSCGEAVFVNQSAESEAGAMRTLGWDRLVCAGVSTPRWPVFGDVP